jgi:hypothetical protein
MATVRTRVPEAQAMSLGVPGSTYGREATTVLPTP